MTKEPNTNLFPNDDEFRRSIERILAKYDPTVGELNLCRCEIDEDNVDWVVHRLSALDNLDNLDISFNSIGETGAVAIAERLTKLTSLHIWNNSIGAAGAAALARRLTNLTTLFLGYNRIGDTGAIIIAEHLKQLTTLDLWANSVSDAGVAALAQNLKELTALYLGGNSISEIGSIAIAQHLTKLRELDLHDNSIGDAGAVAIAKLTELAYLRIQGNRIGDVGAIAIAQGLAKLTSLAIGQNTISEIGAIAIASHLNKLTILHIGDNLIGNDGSAAIAALLKNLTELGIYRNSISNPEIIINLCEMMCRNYSSVPIARGNARLKISVSGNPLRWPDMDAPIVVDILEETRPNKLQRMLLRACGPNKTLAMPRVITPDVSRSETAPFRQQRIGATSGKPCIPKQSESRDTEGLYGRVSPLLDVWAKIPERDHGTCRIILTNIYEQENGASMKDLLKDKRFEPGVNKGRSTLSRKMTTHLKPFVVHALEDKYRLTAEGRELVEYWRRDPRCPGT